MSRRTKPAPARIAGAFNEPVSISKEDPLMPMIKVEMFPGRTAEQKREFAKAVTESFVTICGGTPQSVQVVFQEVEKGDWSVAGALASDAPAAAPAKSK